MRGGGTRVPRPDVRAGVRSARGPRDRVGGGGVRRSPCRSRRARRRRAFDHHRAGLRDGPAEPDRAHIRAAGGKAGFVLGRRWCRDRDRGDDRGMNPAIVPIKRLELAIAPRPWPFAEEHRGEIARHFDKLRETKPALWNGRILLLHQHAIAGGGFPGAYFETDYASFIAWRDWGFPDPTVRNCFSLGALRGVDGGVLLGVMSSHTLNAGKIYFPAGPPDPADIAEGMVDLAGSIRREVAEETGLD